MNHINKTSDTNGYGSRYANIIFSVEKPHDKILSDAGWKVQDRTNSTTIFEYTCKNAYSGDDETVVQYLWADLPDEVTDYFEIDWKHSVY